MFIPIGNDVLGQGLGEAGYPVEQGDRGGIHIHPDRVHAILDHRIQSAGQLALADVVLVLADPDTLGVDFDQLGQRVLQAAGDGDGTADRHVEIRELLRGKFRGGVDRGPRFAHHDFLRFGGGVAFEQIADQSVGLPRGGAVANADKLDLVFLAQLAQGLEALINLAFRFERIDGGVIDQLAGGIHHRHLDPGADARIQPHGAAHTGRSGHQQILEVHGKHLDCLVLCRFADAADQFGLHLQGELDLPGPVHHPLQPLVGRAVL